MFSLLAASANLVLILAYKGAYTGRCRPGCVHIGQIPFFYTSILPTIWRRFASQIF